MSRHRNWCFTINNPEGLLTFNADQVKACWYQEEIGTSGTHHFQGYLELFNPRSLLSVKTFDGFEAAHLEVRRGTRQQAIAYCTKDQRVGGPYLYGDTEDLGGSGKRTDIAAFMEAVEDGMSEFESFDAFPSIHAKYPRFVHSVYERRRVSQLPSLPEFIPRAGWQSDLQEYLSTTADPRKIRWYYDLVGNHGKSYFASLFKPEDSYIVSGGKHADIIYAYRYESIIFFDWPRDAEDRFPYSVAESFKNGYALSTKYEVRRLRFATPHVIVFANFEPDMSKLSVDRFEIIQIT